MNPLVFIPPEEVLEDLKTLLACSCGKICGQGAGGGCKCGTVDGGGA